MKVNLHNYTFLNYYFLLFLSLCNFLYITRLTSLSSSYSPNSMLGMVLVILIFIRSTSSSDWLLGPIDFFLFSERLLLRLLSFLLKALPLFINFYFDRIITWLVSFFSDQCVTVLSYDWMNKHWCIWCYLCYYRTI